MKVFRISLFMFAVLTLAMAADSNSGNGFDTMKSMQGTWEGTTTDGAPVKVVYRVTAGASAVVGEIQGKGPENMISMFHVDNGRLLMTHYCSAGNQPRMQASYSPDGKRISFDFVDGTNIPTAESGHMTQVVFNVIDAKHHTEEWVFSDHGKQIRKVFDLQRRS